MKIWEIEEGREFKLTEEWATSKYKLKNGKLYRLEGESWIADESQFNMVYQCDFEYLPEKRYYLKLKPEMNYRENDDFLNYDFDEKGICLNSFENMKVFKTKFTEKEIKELIPPLWLTVCEEPIEVEDE